MDPVIVAIVGQAIGLVVLILGASARISRQLATLASDYASLKETVKDLKSTIDKLDERHEQMRVQVNGVSRKIERHEVLHERIEKDLERVEELARAAGV